MLGRERILHLLQGKPVDRLPLMPITMMFAADQIGAKYHDYATDYHVLVEAQIVTAERFDLDYVSAISDPAREAADCGAKIDYFEDQPPAIDGTKALLQDKSRLSHLRLPDPTRGTRMLDRIRAVELLRKRTGARRLIEGWIEGPCAEGADLRGISRLMLDFFDDPTFIRDLFDFVVEMGLSFAQAQIEAGADLIGIGDAAASLVGPQIYQEFVWPFEKRLIDGIRSMGARVRLHICGDTRPLLASMGRLGCDIVDLDYFSPLAQAREVMGVEQVLLGNIHPVEVLMKGTPEEVESTLQECYEGAGCKCYIVGAGCEVPRHTPDENLRAMTHFAEKYKG